MQDAIFSLRCCNMTDRGLEALMEFLQSLYSLEINGCNEITEQGLWSSLAPRLISLTVQVNRLRGQTGCPKKFALKHPGFDSFAQKSKEG